MALELTIRPKEVLDKMKGGEGSAAPELDAYEKVRSQTQLDGEQALGAFLRENPVNTALDYTERQARLFGVEEDADFNPFDNIPAGYDNYSDKFMEAKSKQEVALIKDRVDREIGNQYYAEKHPYIAMAMGMAGAVISPESALPVGVGVKGIFAAKTFGMGVKTAANVGATAAASTFTVETLLRSTQPLRSEQERNEAMLFSAGLTSALSGLGAGAVKLLKNKGAEKLVEDLVDYDVSHAQPVKPMEMNLPDDFSPDFPTKFEDRADSPVPQMKELSQAIDNVEVPSRLDIYDDANYTFDVVQKALRETSDLNYDETFQSLYNKSINLQKQADAKFDELKTGGLSDEDAINHPDVKKLEDEYVALDSKSADKAYRLAEKTLMDVLGKGIEKSRIRNFLSNHYYLNEKGGTGSYFLKYANQAMNSPKTIKSAAKDIGKILFEQKYPDLDYNGAMETNISGLTRAEKEDIVNRSFELAQRFNDMFKKVISEDNIAPSKVAEALAQESPTTKAMARLFFNDDNLTVRATPEEIDVRMKRYVEEAKKAGAKVEDAGLETPPQKIINKILQELGSDVRAPRSAYRAVDAAVSEIQDIVRIQERMRARRSVADALDDTGKKVGLSAQANEDVIDSKLAKEKLIKVLSTPIRIFGGGKESTIPSLFAALSDSPLIRRAGAMLVDNGLKYNDPIAARGGQLTAIAEATKRFNEFQTYAVDIAGKAFKEFAEESTQKGIKHKKIRKEFNAELAKAFRTGKSKYSSVTQRVKELRSLSDQIVDEAVEMKILPSKYANYAKEHLSRNYNQLFLNNNKDMVTKRFAEIFKRTASMPSHKNYEFVKAGIDEIRANAENEAAIIRIESDRLKQIKNTELAIIQHDPKLQPVAKSLTRFGAGSDMQKGLGEIAETRIAADFAQEVNEDKWFHKLAEDTVERMMGRPEFVGSDGKLKVEAGIFANFKKGRDLAISDEELMEIGVLNDADPLASFVRNMRLMLNEIAIHRKFGTTDFLEIWEPIEKEYDSMITRGEFKSSVFGQGKKTTEMDKREAQHVVGYLLEQVRGSYSYTSRAKVDDKAAIFLRISNPITGAQQLSGPERNLLFDFVTMGLRSPVNLVRANIEVAKKAMSKQGRMTMRERKRFGLATEAANWRMQYAEPDAMVNAGVPLARLQTGAAKFGAFHRQYLDASNFYEVYISNVAAEMARFGIDDVTKKIAKGKASADDLNQLAELGLNEIDALRIEKMIKKHKTDHPLFEAYNETEWEDGVAAQKYTNALYMFRDLVKNKGHQDVPPMFVRGAGGQIFMRYVGAVSSTYMRTVMRGFQEGIATGAISTMALTAAGAALYTMRATNDGKEVTLQDAFINGTIMGGGGGLAAEVGNKAKYAFGSAMALSDYYQEVDIAKGFAGSHYSGLTSNIEAVFGGVAMATGNRPRSKWIGSMVNSIPLNNAIHVRWAFNELEDLLRTEYGYADKYGKPFEGRSELEQEVRRDVAKAKQTAKTKAEKTPEELAEQAKKREEKKKIKQRLIKEGELK